MLLVVDQENRRHEHIALRSMFEARKRVFVDLLKWDLPVLAGRFEVDQFDDPHATYLIVTDRQGEHLASARLLPTTRPGLLDGLYPHLAEGGVPQGPAIYEITRFCLSRDTNAAMRRLARDILLVGLIDHALANGIELYTGVAVLAWFRQIERFGWQCRPLGPPSIEGGRTLVGLEIAIDRSTLARMAAVGISSSEAGLPAAAA